MRIPPNAIATVLYPLVYALVGVFLWSLPANVAAVATARSNGFVSTPKVSTGPVQIGKGSAAVCARAEVTGQADPPAAAPAAKGCSDLPTITGPSGALVPFFISDAIPHLNGTHEQVVFPNRAGGVAGGRAMRFNAAEAADKRAAALAAPDSILTLMRTAAATAGGAGPAALANATQEVILNPFVRDTIRGNAAVQVAGRPGFAIALVNDPTEISPYNPESSGTVQVTFGSEDELPFLEATEPGDFAALMVELGTIGTDGVVMPLISLALAIDFFTTTIDQTIKSLSVDPASGFANAGAFQSFLLSATEDFLSFDPSVHQFVFKRPIPLLTRTLAPDEVLTLSYGYGAVAGSVPEPSAQALLAAGIGLLLAAGVRRAKASGC